MEQAAVGIRFMLAGGWLLLWGALTRPGVAAERRRELLATGGGCLLALGLLQHCTPQPWLPALLWGAAAAIALLLLLLRLLAAE